MDNGIEEVLTEFLVESFENIDQLDHDLLALESNPADASVLESIFRNVHTIKGTCGFLGLARLEEITHAGESLLSLLRDGVATVDAATMTALLALTDTVRNMLVTLETTHAEGDTDYTELLTTLAVLQDQARNGTAPTAPAADATVQPDGVRMGEVLVRQGDASEVEVAIGLIQQEAGDSRRIGEILADQGVVSGEAVERAAEVQANPRSMIVDSTLRVDVGLLDQLMTLVGELVLARNQILQVASAETADPLLVGSTQRLNAITTELQTGLMKTRMQPIGHVWSKFPRLARDVASACGKQVRIEMEGRDTELDKTIVEAIKDPLTHVLRNSIDHGIESPEVRRGRGKPEEGTVLLRAFHEGGQVNIEIIDDGGGIDIAKVKQKAVERRLITPDQAASMNDRDATNLVFLPGFSTAETVSNISGRGVGMDVVKTNIEKIGGSIDFQSSPGVGSTLRIRIPLTLAIIPALIVKCSNEQFAIPQVNLLELVGVHAEEIDTAIEYVHGAPVYRLRGNILPLVHLNEQLDLVPTYEDGLTILVLKIEDREFGLVVDRVLDTEEIVVKPLSPQLKNLSAFSGCTIMGDGTVALILDVTAIGRTAHAISESAESLISDDSSRSGSSDETNTWLVLQAGSARVVVPLDAIDRLESFPADTLEHASGSDVVQYRNGLLPLIDVGASIGSGYRSSELERIPVVVFARGKRCVGLAVDAIVDIVHDNLHFEHVGHRYGVVGSAVVQGTASDLLDVSSIIASVDPEFFSEMPDYVSSGQEASHV